LEKNNQCHWYLQKGLIKIDKFFVKLNLIKMTKEVYQLKFIGTNAPTKKPFKLVFDFLFLLLKSNSNFLELFILKRAYYPFEFNTLIYYIYKFLFVIYKGSSLKSLWSVNTCFELQVELNPFWNTSSATRFLNFPHASFSFLWVDPTIINPINLIEHCWFLGRAHEIVTLDFE
jgi:hypothetical protein